MSGRTDRVNARELSDRVETIILEGDSAAGWVQNLVKRSATALKAARANKFYSENYASEMAELERTHDALKAAAEALETVTRAAEKLEKDVAA